MALIYLPILDLRIRAVLFVSPSLIKDDCVIVGHRIIIPKFIYEHVLMYTQLQKKPIGYFFGQLWKNK